MHIGKTIWKLFNTCGCSLVLISISFSMEGEDFEKNSGAVGHKYDTKSKRDFENTLENAKSLKRTRVVENLHSLADFEELKGLPKLPSSEELLANSVFVHMTPHFPVNGQIIAGESIKGGIVPSDSAIPSRATIHFSWNKPLDSKYHTDKTILKRPYCIIEPAAEVMDQWYGGWTEDLMVIGDYVLSEKSTILVPEQELEQLRREHPEFRGKLLSYNPKEITCAEFALAVIKMNYKAWNVEFTGDPAKGEGNSRIKDHKGQEFEIDTKALFSSILGGRYWGHHQYVRIGIVNTILTFLNTSFQGAHEASKRNLYQQEPTIWKHYIASSSEVEKALCLYEYHNSKLMLEAENISSKVLSFLRDRAQIIEGWLNLIRFDLNLRKGRRCSIFVHPAVLSQMIKLRTDTDALRLTAVQFERQMHHALLGQQEFLRMYRGRINMNTPYPYDDPIMYKVLAGMKRDEVRDMLSKTKLKVDERSIEYAEEHMDRFGDFPLSLRELYQNRE